MPEKTLKDLFHDTLKDIYFAERQILKTSTEAGQGREIRRT